MRDCAASAGVGEWTAQYIALRAIREMDAFPASDIGLLRGAARMDGERPTSASLLTARRSGGHGGLMRRSIFGPPMPCDLNE